MAHETPSHLALAHRARAVLRAVPWPVLPAVATVLLLCLPDQRGDVGGGPHVTPADLASMGLVGYCALRVLRDRARPLTRTAAVVLGAPALAVAVATVAADDPSSALTGFARCTQIFVLVPIAVVLLLRSRRDFRWVAGAVVVLAVVQGAVGVRQYVTGTGASYAGRDVRAVGTFGPLDVMAMATTVGYGALIALSVGLALPPTRTGARWPRRAALCCAAALLVPLALSFSRGAWIATACAGTVVLFLHGARRALRVMAALAAVAVLAVCGLGAGSGLMAERLDSITRVSAAPDRSVTDRYSLWAAATDIWRDHPVTGVGPKGFAAHRDGHASIGLSAASDTAGAGHAFQREPLLSPHNMYLLVLSEQGLIGAVALLGCWSALLLCGLTRLSALRRAGRMPLPGHAAMPPQAAAAQATAAQAAAPQAAAPGCAGARRGATGCGAGAVGLLVWQAVDFLYADIGGPTTVLTSVVLGLAAWWALSPAALRDAPPTPGERASTAPASGPPRAGLRPPYGRPAFHTANAARPCGPPSGPPSPRQASTPRGGPNVHAEEVRR
ncbi:O-antigen ligase family protein [Streptomyces buecherae]|uniref:O-antigen ligase family protein n=1 Tax=Streptomyces buecherae TaxID=2763006 RepID=A0A7H8NKR0_9ACTN|nr:O-antigen ligase family protein [Streptomyces buecherae]